jgi:predicted TIM-barrel fold metal-dependent hydrolase
MVTELRVVDSDAHVIEPEDMWKNYLDPEFRDEMPRHWCGYAGDPLAFEFGLVIPSAQAGAQYIMPTGSSVLGERIPAVFKGSRRLELEDAYDKYAAKGFTPDCYLDALPKVGIEYMVVYPTVCLYTTAVPSLSAATAAAYRRAYNRWLGDFCAQTEGKLIGATSIDFRDPVEAANEVRRCAKEYNFRAVYANPTPVNNYPLYHESFEPLWNALEECDVPLVFHGGAGNSADKIVAAFTPDLVAGRAAIAFGIHYMLQCSALIAGGVLEAHPKLRVGFLEAGVGWASYWIDRIEAGNQGGTRGFIPRGLNAHPFEYFQRQCYVAAEQDDPGIKSFVEAFGTDNLVFSTDFGHSEGRMYASAVEDFSHHPDLTGEQAASIMWDNGLKLYGIQPT